MNPLSKPAAMSGFTTWRNVDTVTLRKLQTKRQLDAVRRIRFTAPSQGRKRETSLAQTFLFRAAPGQLLPPVTQSPPVNEFVGFTKEFLVPGSAWFLVLTASMCALLLYFKHTARAGRFVLAATAAVYWLMSMPIVAHGLQATQRLRFTSQASEAAAGEALPIVVLGNGLGEYVAGSARIEVPLAQTAMNALSAANRYHQSPALVVVSGGAKAADDHRTPEAALIRDALVRNGVPMDRIVLEPGSTNTHEQAIEISKILRVHRYDRCQVVTSPQQMPRAIELFRRERIVAYPRPAGAQLWAPLTPTRWSSWLVPSTEARAVSRDVIYEWMAWPYYRARGWIE